ncbi:MAG: histidine phosphatase family protein [Elusimicrobiales bacterium]|nr:histidine phosphatase family protein [Elusimicrobiales bacterium]
MHLVIVRHGDALPKSEDSSDFLRHLSEEGKVKVKKAAESLKLSGFKFDFILSSPLVRALETAEIFSFIMDISLERLIISEKLRGEVCVRDAYEFLSLYLENNVIVVSHMPLVSNLTYELVKKNIYFNTASYLHLIKTGDKFDIFSKYNL